MKFRRGITVFVRSVEGGGVFWKRYPVAPALVTKTLEANSNISAKGLVPNSKIIVRFPPQSGFELKPGDVIYIGGTEESSPPDGSCPVLSVTGGDRGSKALRLVKAVCG